MRQASGLAVVTPNDTPSTSGYVTPQCQNPSVESLDAVNPGIGRPSEDQANNAHVAMAGEAKVYTSNWVNIFRLDLFSSFYTETAHRASIPLIDI